MAGEKLKVFEARGRFTEKKGKFTEKGREKKFSKVVEARDDSDALEKVLSLMGSAHKIKRRHIFIEEMKEIADGEGKKKEV